MKLTPEIIAQAISNDPCEDEDNCIFGGLLANKKVATAIIQDMTDAIAIATKDDPTAAMTILATRSLTFQAFSAVYQYGMHSGWEARRILDETEQLERLSKLKK